MSEQASAVMQSTRSEHLRPIPTAKELHTPTSRVAWISDILVRGEWDRAYIQACADVWGCAPNTIISYAHKASIHVNLVTNDRDKLIALSKHRLNKLADAAERDADKIAANMGLLKSSGALSDHRVPRDADKDLESDDAKKQAINLLRNPGPNMAAVLRAAFTDPGPGLRLLLDEFATYPVFGEEFLYGR